MAGFEEEFEKIYIRYFNDVFLFLKKLSKVLSSTLGAPDLSDIRQIK